MSRQVNVLLIALMALLVAVFAGACSQDDSTSWASDTLGGDSFQSGLTVDPLPDGFEFVESEGTSDGNRSAVMHNFENESGDLLVIGRLRAEIADVVPGTTIATEGREFVVAEDSRGIIVSEDLGHVVVVTISRDMAEDEIIQTAVAVSYDETKDP